MVLGSEIRDPRSGIRKKPIPDPGSRGQKGTGSWIRIRNTATYGIQDKFFRIQTFKFSVPDLELSRRFAE